ncbi:TetR/AcrR family transcriptional regulator [Oerskovia turbata]|uniref:TetR/AcrR family transcriptional regulator n=1 Tax=Oerskovia turbata TaxID=1713 RepID=A0A4Q1KQB4_9CELL|nr:TetR/AcrR family transcriptional regulator [Oerskovia turbata]RXR23101.1 TetR/AcrR family transcriptional regulator [Oerskovia turbata]RXR31700.1 TetR/AcrR family transcriptional regulator [Oerskovia turbata]TGJ97236.1 TetR/AcrR family transcriptional regulator [Actinotalea fermentans ATCC 43279 = JCM 9966 = DSM 3133]
MSLREALVVAATELLDEGGAENVTLREVGRRTGVSRTAPYVHFASKSALLATIAARELQELVLQVEALPLEGRTSTDVLRGAMLHYVRWARERPERFHLVFGRWPEESEELRQAAARANELLVDLVHRSQAEGALPPGDLWNTAAAIRAFAHGVAVLDQAGHLLGADRRPLDAVTLVESYLALVPEQVFGCAKVRS